VLKKTFLYLLSILINISVFSQTPCFITSDTIGCLPHTVTLQDCSGASAFVYVYEENGTSDTTTSNTYTYTTGGLHTITQLIGTVDGLLSLTKTDYIKTIDRPLPEYTLYACEGLDVIIYMENDEYEKYIISYDDGSPNDTVLPYSTTTKTYLDNAVKTISVIGFYENFDCTNNESKTVKPIISLEEPQLIELALSNGSPNKTATISFSTNILLEYYYEEKATSSTYQIIDSIQPTSNSITLTFDDIINTPYCYRVSSFDRCGNSIQSKEICTIELAVTATNNQNELNWTTYAFPSQVNTYQIIKDDNNLTNTTTAKYTDTDVFCGTTYCYQITTLLNYTNTTTGSTVTSTSQTECAQALSSDIPPPIENLQSSFNFNQLSIHWKQPNQAPVATYHLQENLNNTGFSVKENFVSPDTSKTVSLSTETLSTVCYKLNYTDICGNLAPISSTTCPIILTIAKNEDGSYQAIWTSYSGYTVQNYWLNMYDTDQQLIEQIELGTALNYTFEWPNNENQQIVFVISATGNDEDLESYSTSISLEEETLILIPNAFTPNEDELNETFKPIGRFIDSYSMSIFNSMGTITFVSSENQTDWDGKSNDKHVPEGTYYYEMTITDKKGKNTTKNGSVTVIY
jgi:gliding motility-associated-like protein